MRVLAVSSLLLAATLGCEADEQCEKMRVELSKSWGLLRESATKRKLAGVDAQSWTKIEERAALLESSFLTPQVTWQSADKARSEFGELVRAVQTDSPANLTGYRLSSDAALKQQEAYAQRCR